MFNTEIVQSCSAFSNYTEVGGIIFRELNKSLIFLVFSHGATNISSSFEKCYPFISLSSFLIFDASNFSCKFLLPPNINVLCSNKRSRTGSTHFTLHGVHAVPRPRNHALTCHVAYSLVLWTITKLKHVLTTLLENNALYVDFK